MQTDINDAVVNVHRTISSSQGQTVFRILLKEQRPGCEITPLVIYHAGKDLDELVGEAFRAHGITPGGMLHLSGNETCKYLLLNCATHLMYF